MRFTVIAAASFEFDPICASPFDSLVDEYLELGVGVMESMYRLPLIESRLKQRNILYIGTAGIFGGFHSPRLAAVSKVEWLPTGDRLGVSYPVPKPDSVNLPLLTSLTDKLEKHTCVCGPSVSVDSNNSIDRYANCLENIELFGIASKIAPVARTFSSTLAISNSVGPAAHEQWKHNWKVCAQMTADYLTSIIGELRAI